MADVVILSSDEEIEDERDTTSLFQDFLAKVEPFVDRTVVVLLSMKFDEVRDAVGHSSPFRSLLQRKLRVVKHSDAYIHTAEVCKKLCKVAKNETAEPEACKTTADNEESLRQVRHEPNECDGDSFDGRVTSSAAGKFENANKASTSQETLQDIDDIVIVEVPGETEIGKQNTAKQASPRPTCSAAKAESRAEAILSPSKRKKVIKRLEQKMKVVADKIKILNKAELSLEEMAMNDSTYLKESRLKETFNKYWNKICSLQGKPPNTGRVIEKEVKIQTTGYPAVDEEVKKFMKKRKSFPDIFDVKEVIEKANKRHDLRISAPVLKEIAEEVFTNIGNRLQRRRKIDFTNNFGCSLTDDYDMDQDPALHDPELRKKLERNHKKNKRALNKVFRKYVHYDRLKYYDSQDDGSGTGQSEYENGKSSHCRRVVKKVKSSSESDSELNEGLSQSSQTRENSDSDDEGIQRPSHRRKSAKVKINNSQTSDTSDFEDEGRIAQPSTVEDPGDIDLGMSSQETASSLHPVEPQPSVENDPEKLGRTPERSPEGHAFAAENVEEVANSSRSSPQHPGKPQRKGKSHHLANGAVDSGNNGVITIDDDIDDKLTWVATEAIPGPCNDNLTASPQEEAANIKNLKEKKESCEVQKEAPATASNGDGSAAARVAPCDSHATVPAAAKSASLRGLIKLSPVCISKTLQNSADSAETKTGQKKVGAVKRPADNDITYESPLKMFRKSTLELLLEQGASDKPVLGPGNNYGASTNGHNSCKSDSVPHKSPEIVGENSTVSRPDGTPRKSLSLKKKPPNKVLNNKPVTVIVLSDDESD